MKDVFAINLSGDVFAINLSGLKSSVLPKIEGVFQLPQAFITTLVPAGMWYPCNSTSCVDNLRPNSRAGGCNLKVSFTTAVK